MSVQQVRGWFTNNRRRFMNQSPLSLRYDAANQLYRLYRFHQLTADKFASYVFCCAQCCKLHERRTIVIDVHGVCQSVSVSFVVQKTAEQIDVSVGLETFENPMHIVLDRGPDASSMQPSPNYFGNPFV